MLANLGCLSLVMALVCAVGQVSCQRAFSWHPAFLKKSLDATSRKKRSAGMTNIFPLTQFFFLSLAMLCLMLSFLTNDLSIIYVNEHSHYLLPFIYRIGATWSGHEGSLLLWCLILSGWTVVFLFCSQKKLSSEFFSAVMKTLGIVSTGFISFLLFTSNPFKQDFLNAPQIGNDLTPVLQDPGLIFHPPMLYFGYVGFAIGFAFAIAALITGKFESDTARACRPWIIFPWSLLSVGIVLGSWWAYRELGWGGWWFWDPVENASLLPWLSATALIHSLIVSEKRNVFKGWTILLAIITFALSLIGTFLVRSGVLVSVHAFSNDPTRGIFLLSYLALLIGGALLLYTFRIKKFYQAPNFNFFSRETFLLMNSVILVTAVATILLGTLYPIILDALNIEKISVGEPYFNTVFTPLMLILILLMGLAPHLKWSKAVMPAERGAREVASSDFKLKTLDATSRKKRSAGMTMIPSTLLGFSLPPLFGFNFYFLTAIALSFSIYLLLSTCVYAYQHKKINSMVIAHIGIAVIALGITANKSFSEERQIKMKPGETVSLAGYQFKFENMNETQSANYQSLVANFTVTKNNFSSKISAEQRLYAYEKTLGKPGIIFNPWRDLHLVLGNNFPDDAWAIRIYYKPFVRWIWAGGFLLFIAGMVSLLKYYKRSKS